MKSLFADIDKQATCIALLETLLEKAKAGEFEAITAILETEEGNVLIASTPFQSITQKLGSIELAKYDLLVDSQEGADEDDQTTS